MKRNLVAAIALLAAAAFASTASADCTPGHSAKKETSGQSTGT